jgi:hypothetical protein
MLNCETWAGKRKKKKKKKKKALHRAQVEGWVKKTKSLSIITALIINNIVEGTIKDKPHTDDRTYFCTKY